VPELTRLVVSTVDGPASRLCEVLGQSVERDRSIAASTDFRFACRRS
jgi:hypothetical protein